MQKYIETIKMIYGYYQGGNTSVVLYFMIFIVALFIIKNQCFRTYILYPILVELIFIFNPFSIAVFVDTGLLSKNRYVRLFWLIQVSIVIAGVACECIQRVIKTKNKKIILILLLCFIIMGTGNYIFTGNDFQKATNIYKLPSYVVEVTEAIRDECKNEGRNVSDIRIAVPVSLAPYIRQYDGNIKMLYGRNIENNVPSAKVQSLMQESELNIEEITNYAKQGECDYIVLENTKVFLQEPEEYDFILVDKVGSYSIYKRTSKKEQNFE